MCLTLLSHFPKSFSILHYGGDVVDSALKKRHVTPYICKSIVHILCTSMKMYTLNQ